MRCAGGTARRRSSPRPEQTASSGSCSGLCTMTPCAPRVGHDDTLDQRIRTESHDNRPEEGRSVPGGGARQRASADPSAPVADRDDAARELPHGAGEAPARDAGPRRARRRAARASSARQQPGRWPRSAPRESAARPGAGARQDADRPGARDRRRGEDPQERQGRLRRPRRSRSRPTPRSSSLARAVGDDETAKLAASIRADEERMLRARHCVSCPKLTDAVVGPRSTATRPTTSPRPAPPRPCARRRGARRHSAQGRAATAHGAPGAQGPGRRARRGPGQGRAWPPRTTWRSPATTSSPRTRSSRRLPQLSQIDLAKVEAYERKQRQPHDGPGRGSGAARRRAVARLRRADRRRDPRRARRRDERRERRPRATSARTRTAPACSAPRARARQRVVTGGRGARERRARLVSCASSRRRTRSARRRRSPAPPTSTRGHASAAATRSSRRRMPPRSTATGSTDR